MAWIPWASASALLVMAAVYLLKYRGHPPDKYVPMAAWLRAGIYFCFCYLVAWYSGALPAALAGPVATQAQLENPIWQAWVLGLFVLVTIGYWVIWARFSIRFDRKLELLPQVFFGLAWGLAAGFLFLSFWHLVDRGQGARHPYSQCHLLPDFLRPLRQLLDFRRPADLGPAGGLHRHAHALALVRR